MKPSQVVMACSCTKDVVIASHPITSTTYVLQPNDIRVIINSFKINNVYIRIIFRGENRHNHDDDETMTYGYNCSNDFCFACVFLIARHLDTQ